MIESCAVICEFNPIHLGHRYILSKAREHIGSDGCLVAVMSGNFTERCTPAIYDKYTRAHSALLGGADLVVELPFPWCSSGVEDFVLGGVGISAELHASSLTFGSESGNKDIITRSAEAKSSEKFKETVIRIENEKRNAGSAVIFAAAMAELGITEDLGPNDKLGIEYMISGCRYGISDFNIIKRDESFTGALNIREKIFAYGIDAVQSQILPSAYELFKLRKVCSEKRYDEILFDCARLMICESEENSNLRYTKALADECASAEEFVKNLPHKKHTLARMRRELLFHILGAADINRKSPPLFTVLLGANKRGRGYLKYVKKTAGISIITKPADIPDNESIKKQYRLNQAADRLYSLCISERADTFMRMSPVII